MMGGPLPDHPLEFAMFGIGMYIFMAGIVQTYQWISGAIPDLPTIVLTTIGGIVDQSPGLIAGMFVATAIFLYVESRSDSK